MNEQVFFGLIMIINGFISIVNGKIQRDCDWKLLHITGRIFEVVGMISVLLGVLILSGVIV